MLRGVARGCVIPIRAAGAAGVPIIALQSPSGGGGGSGGLMLTNVLWTCMAAAAAEDENDGRFVIVKMDVEGDRTR